MRTCPQYLRWSSICVGPGLALLSALSVHLFLAASSSSRSLVVVGLSVCLSRDFVKKLPLEYQIVTKTYLKPTYLPTYATVVTVVPVVTVMTVVKVVTVVTKNYFTGAK